MKQRRVVLVMIEPPLPFGNAAGRWFYVLLRGLVERGHQVTAFAACSKEHEIAAAKDLFPSHMYELRCFPAVQEEKWRSKLKSLERPHSYLFSEKMIAALQKTLAAGFDILHLEQLWSGWLGLGHTDKALLNVHYSFRVDLEGVPISSLADMARRVRAEQAERHLLRSYPVVTAVCEGLAQVIRGLSPNSRVLALPFGMDTSLYPFEPGPQPDRPPTVGLIGSFGWAPTRSAGERLLTTLWPEIRRRVPSARLLIVGRGAQSAFGSFHNHAEVEVHDNVPDTKPFFANCDTFLYAPRAGSGIKVKILEAFALGAPVVTNAEGVDGIPALDGVHVRLAHTDDALVRETVGLLTDPDRRARQRTAARTLIAQHCDPQNALNSLESVYDLIAPSRVHHQVA